MTKEISPCTVYTDKVKEAIESVPEEYQSLTPQKLTEKVNPSIKLYELRRAFWEEITFAQENNCKMRNWRIYEGKGSKQWFYSTILSNPLYVAWITQPLMMYEDKTKAVLDRAVERYDEIINMEITSTRRIKDPEAEGGYRIVEETCPKKALVLLQAIKNLEDRVKGTSVQRQLNIHSGRPEGSGIRSASLNMDTVNTRLAELESKLGGGNNEGQQVSQIQSRNSSGNQGKDDRADKHDVIDAEWSETSGKLDEEYRVSDSN